jgi:two-component system sensor histidine kinase YesM
MVKAWFYRSMLKKRIRVAFTALTIFCIGVTGMLSYAIASRAMERNAMGLSQNVLDKSVRILDERLKQIIVASSTLMLSEPYRQTIRDMQSNSENQYFKNFSLLQIPFAQAELTEKSIDSILISSPMGDFYPTTKIRRHDVPFQQTFLYKHIKENPQDVWVAGHTDQLFMGESSVISLLLQPLSEYYVPDLFLTVNVKEEMIIELLKQDLSEDSMNFVLIQKDGENVLQSQTRPDWLSSQSFKEHIDSNNSSHFELDSEQGRILINYAQSAFAENWLLVGYQSKDRLLSPIRSIQWLMLAIMAGCIVVALMLSRIMSDLLLRPLNTLQRVMKKVEQNDLSARFQSPFQDEIGEAGQQFNRMLGTIDQLITEVRETEADKRKAEVKALQAQIEPHFLYNTLNTVFWKCEMEEYEDVKEMVLSLSLLFRLGLNSGNEITTLGKELEHVRQYLNIQQKCYEELFVYTIEVDEEWLNVPILKVLLQPLVENSILHGMKEMKAQGDIRIVVTKQQDHLLIRVSDNGMGMDVNEVNRKLNETEQPRQSFALFNVKSRLQLYYGQSASLSISSRPYTKTEITISIPLQQEEA